MVAVKQANHVYHPCVVVCCYLASVKPHFLEWTLADSDSLEARSQIDFLIHLSVDPVTLTGCFLGL